MGAKWRLLDKELAPQMVPNGAKWHLFLTVHVRMQTVDPRRSDTHAFSTSVLYSVRCQSTICMLTRTDRLPICTTYNTVWWSAVDYRQWIAANVDGGLVFVLILTLIFHGMVFSLQSVA